ncbi:hypothetical protein ACP70R_005221 [Stipagrostis hirtigluma subsp. patula]
MRASDKKAVYPAQDGCETTVWTTQDGCALFMSCCQVPDGMHSKCCFSNHRHRSQQYAFSLVLDGFRCILELHCDLTHFWTFLEVLYGTSRWPLLTSPASFCIG